MNNKTKAFENFKRGMVFIMGVVVLLTSLYFSREGFSFKVDVEGISWVGWVLAFAVTAGQFMFNTRAKDLDWTIILIGVVAYGYSIWSNILGFYSLRGTEGLWDWMNISGGIFMDVFPEKAIAWSLGIIKAGDLVGNLVNVISNPNRVSNENVITTMNVKPKYPASLPRREMPFTNSYPLGSGTGGGGRNKKSGTGDIQFIYPRESKSR